MRIFRIAAVLLAGLIATACLPVTTTNPVGAHAGPSPDPALTGTWKGTFESDDKDDGGIIYMTFLPQKDGTTTAVMVRAPGKNDDGGWMAVSLTTAVLGGQHYMNAVPQFEDNKAADDKDKQNIPVAYAIDGDTLTLNIIGEKAASAAIAAGRIQGTAGEGDYGDVTITAAPAALDTFLATRAGRALFTEKLGTFTRLN